MYLNEYMCKYVLYPQLLSPLSVWDALLVQVSSVSIGTQHQELLLTVIDTEELWFEQTEAWATKAEPAPPALSS